jgi:exosome complex component RRP42
MTSVVSEISKKTILDLVENNTRLDGRTIDQFRKAKITTGIIPNAQGSALVELGLTKVLAGVKLAVGTPYPDKLEDGVLSTGAEMAPIASPDFEKGPPSAKSVEFARVVDRVIRESEIIDTKKLCIKPREKVWMLYVDLYTLDMDGNLIDAGVLAGMAALLTAKMPKYDPETDSVDYETLEGPVPVKGKAIGVTHAKIGTKLIVDPTEEEEEVMSCRFTVGVNEEGEVCAIQKGGVAGFTDEEIIRMIEASVKHAAELRELLP